MSLPLVTAVVPVYNADRFIAETIRSVIAQTYPRVEIIVVDDGSTDASAAIVESFADDVRLLRQANRGVAHARNAGVEAARGEYVAFLDADDLWLPEKIEQQVASVRRTADARSALGPYLVVTEDLRVRYRVPMRDANEAIRRAITLDHWGVAFGSTALVERGEIAGAGWFREGSETEDLEFAARLGRRAPIATVAEPLAMYRTHPAQVHLDWDRKERGMLRLYSDIGLVMSEAERTRGKANLAVRSAYRRAIRGEFRPAAQAAREALGLDPTRLLLAPIEAAGRRVSYRARGATSSTSAG